MAADTPEPVDFVALERAVKTLRSVAAQLGEDMRAPSTAASAYVVGYLGGPPLNHIGHVLGYLEHLVDRVKPAARTPEDGLRQRRADATESAYRRLRANHPAEYRRLYAEESRVRSLISQEDLDEFRSLAEAEQADREKP